jgi:7-cyano-7-deazaguanine synthase
MTGSVVVLLSGGVDSVTLAHMAHDAGRLNSCVFVDYGQPSERQEHLAAWRCCERLGARLHVLTCQIPGAKWMEAGEGVEGSRYVPARNMVLLSLAVAHAKNVGADVVWYGATAEDAEDYPDCRASFVDAMDAVAKMTEDVWITAPLVGTSRTGVLAIANATGVHIDDCWSCYEPIEGVNPCGLCNSCKQPRRTA